MVAETACNLMPGRICYQHGKRGKHKTKGGDEKRKPTALGIFGKTIGKERSDVSGF